MTSRGSEKAAALQTGLPFTRVRRGIALLLCPLLWPGLGAIADELKSAPAANATVNAVWLRQELLLYYTGHRTLYTCQSIEEKVRAVLLDMGAREDLKVEASGCVGYFKLESRLLRPPGRPPQNVVTMPTEARGDVRVNIQLATPTVLTPALLDVLRSRQGERELLARVEGRPVASSGIRAFPATWQRLELSRAADKLDDSDCELVEEIARQVLPKLNVRPISNATRCVASQSSSRGSHARLMADVLIAVPGADEIVTPLQPPPAAP
jgi:hypothetical protein